eukprot:4722600-Alexandrium_andersonii.AAC.1
MSASLVGSEMCIRDRSSRFRRVRRALPVRKHHGGLVGENPVRRVARGSCLLYTSDAADDM